MTNSNRNYNQNVIVGCGVLGLLAMVGLGALMILAVKQDYQAARYPDAVAVASHSNYSGLPTHIRWDQTFRTTDDFTSVYNWYSITFDLGAEARALERCILLEGSTRQLLVERHTSVFLCNTPGGQLISVSRSTSLK